MDIDRGIAKGGVASGERGTHVVRLNKVHAKLLAALWEWLFLSYFSHHFRRLHNSHIKKAGLAWPFFLSFFLSCDKENDMLLYGINHQVK
ncbi:hypothetical protein Hanom_Chr16g01415061 [Helianthus anomalus]